MGRITEAERAEFRRYVDGERAAEPDDADQFRRTFETLPDIGRVEPQPRPRPRRKLLRDARAGEDVPDVSVRQMTQAKARGKLESFLRDCRRRGRRVVKVIHGKGRNSPGGRAVLRERVPEWLGEWSDLVETWEATDRRHGGEGALWVVLKP